MTRVAPVVALALVTVLGGCGQPHAADVRSVAAAFYAAHAARDGAAACAVLAPETRRELEESAGTACAEAVLGELVPGVTAPTDVRVFGTQAEVVWDGETTFLARFRTGWRVMAAVCEPRPGEPYDCAITGG